MRSFRAISTSYIFMPNAYAIMIIVAFIGILSITSALKHNHFKGISRNNKNGIILIIIGAVAVLIGYSVSLDVLRYTHGSEKATAIVTKIDIEYDSDSNKDYTYTVTFTYNDREISVDMRARQRQRMNLEKGDSVDIYFYPEPSDSEREPITVAVDLELANNRKYITAGIVACIAGLFLIILTKQKTKLLSDGFHTSAKIMQLSIAPTKYVRSRNRQEWIMVCHGKNPGTGMLQTFQTKGDYTDFGSLQEGDIVHVFISKKNDRFYIINI